MRLAAYFHTLGDTVFLALHRFDTALKLVAKQAQRAKYEQRVS